jgi:flagellar hook-associated protein 1 FlgK
MSGSYYIALSGLNAAQSGLDVVSQNISNASTPGYVRERLNLSNLVAPTTGAGEGVMTQSISLVSSAFLTNSLNSTSAQQGYATSLSQVLSTAQSFLNEPSSSGISTQLANFWSAFDGVANSPTQLAPRQQLVSQAQNLAQTFNQLAQNYVDLFNSTVASVGTKLQSVNSMLSQVATLNTQIVAAGPASSNTLVDQRNQLVGDLATSIGATVQNQPNGSVNLLVGGVMLVQDGVSSTLSVSSPTAPPVPTTSSVTVISSQGGVSVPLTQGTVGGLLQTLNFSLPEYSTSLDKVAASLASTVNNQLSAGSSYPNNGSTPQSGVPMFVFGGSGSTGALNLQINPTIVSDPYSIAAAGNPPQGNADGSNAQAMAELGTLSSGPDALYRAMVGGIGLDVSNSNSLLSSAQVAYQNSYQQFQSVSGVNTNQQLVDMLNYQQGYQAAAKVISTVSKEKNKNTR